MICNEKLTLYIHHSAVDQALLEGFRALPRLHSLGKQCCTWKQEQVVMTTCTTFICLLRYVQGVRKQIHFIYARSLEYHGTVFRLTGKYGWRHLREMVDS